MYLMLAVYFVNNFTYNTKIWFLLAAISILIYFVQKVLYFFSGEVLCIRDFPIKEGEEYTLTENIQSLLAGDVVKIARFSESSGLVYIYKNSEERYKPEFSLPLKDFLNKVTNKEAIFFKTVKPNKVFLTLCIIFSVLHIAVPSKSTAQYMVGAYILEEVITSEAAKELGSSAIKIAKNQLEIWASENQDLNKLIDKSFDKK